VVVTGKGGAGKTTLAAALGRAAAARGLRALVVETGRDEQLPRLFGWQGPPAGHAGLDLPGGPRLMHLSPHEALAEYLRFELRVPLAATRRLTGGPMRALLAAAPGWRELITLGKLWHLERQRGAAGLDLIILDAPATGHGLAFLDAPRAATSALRGGPLRRHAEWVEALVCDAERTLLLPVALPEETPVRETRALVRRAQNELGIAVDRVVANAVESGSFPPGLADLDQRLAALPERLPGAPSPRALARCAAHLRQRRAAQKERLAALAEATALPLLILPRLPQAVRGPEDLDRLAAPLLAQPQPGPQVTGTGGARLASQPGGAPHSAADAARVADAADAGAVEELVARRRVVACVGPGGVGKTTLAAALALGAARRGRRALVVTVDPARRLADALGLPALDDQPRRVPVPGATGALWALMLDSRRTYDALVARLAPNADTRARIHANPIYQRISRALAGSVEYAAMLKVFELQSRADLDLVVVDTPPSAHALDFLDAPARLLRLLDSPALQWLVNPALRAGRLGWRWFRRGGQQVLRALERVTGLAFLEDLSEFLLAFEGMSGGFRQRARAVQQLLFGPDCAFVLASGPGELASAQARDFLARLEERGAHPQGVVLNRLRTLPGPGGRAEPAGGANAGAAEAAEAAGRAGAAEAAGADGARAALRESFAARFGAEFPADLAAESALRLWRNAAEAAALDTAAAAPLLADAGRLGAFARCIPEFAADVHDLDGLAVVEQHLFATRAADAGESQNRPAGGGRGAGEPG